MDLSTAAFYLVALITVGSALMVAFSRNIIYSAFSLLGTFARAAGLYVFLGAAFVAAVQLLIYVCGMARFSGSARPSGHGRWHRSSSGRAPFSGPPVGCVRLSPDSTASGNCVGQSERAHSSTDHGGNRRPVLRQLSASVWAGFFGF